MARVSRKRSKKKTQGKTAAALAAVLFCAAIALYFIISGLKTDDRGVIQDALAEAAGEELSKAGDVAFMLASGKYSIDDGINYEKVFEGNVILGDSITEGLSAYGYLNEEQVFCEIGGSVMKSANIVKRAAAVKPKNAFFSYGTNDMGMYNGNAEMFTEKYASVIKAFMELSPDTKIYVNSISKPSESKIAAGGHYHKWESFNAAIKDMCGSLGVEYIDNVYILLEHPELYAGDGIHVSTSYYPYWLENMTEQADLLWS